MKKVVSGGPSGAHAVGKRGTSGKGGHSDYRQLSKIGSDILQLSICDMSPFPPPDPDSWGEYEEQSRQQQSDYRRQNQQRLDANQVVDDLQRRYNFNDDIRRQLHDQITRQNYTPEEIEQILQGLLGQ